MSKRHIETVLAVGLVVGAFHFLPGPCPAATVINEFVANHVGADDHELIEIFSTPNTDLSTLTVLEIEGDGSVAGRIDDAIPVGTTNVNGFFVTAFFASKIENGTLTLLLVENFSGLIGDDVDTDNDGVLDVTPFSSVLDGIAVTDGGASDRTYAGVVLNVSSTTGGYSRIPNGVDTNSASDWVGNDFDGAGLPGFAGTLESDEALNTPGTFNSTTIPLPTSVWCALVLPLICGRWAGQVMRR